MRKYKNIDMVIGWIALAGVLMLIVMPFVML